MYKPFCGHVFFLKKMFFYFVLVFSWWKCCDSFRWRTKGLSHTYLYSPLSSPAIWGHVFSFLLSMLILCLNFLGSQAIFQRSYFTSLLVMYENSSFSTFFNTCYFLCFFNQWMKSQKITIHTPLRLWLCLPRLQRNQSI